MGKSQDILGAALAPGLCLGLILQRQLHGLYSLVTRPGYFGVFSSWGCWLWAGLFSAMGFHQRHISCSIAAGFRVTMATGEPPGQMLCFQARPTLRSQPPTSTLRGGRSAQRCSCFHACSSEYQITEPAVPSHWCCSAPWHFGSAESATICRACTLFCRPFSCWSAMTPPCMRISFDLCRAATQPCMSLPQMAVPPLGDAREDWTIIRAVSEVLDVTLPYDDSSDIRRRLQDVAPHLTRVGNWDAPLWLNGQYFKVGEKSLGSPTFLFHSGSWQG